jgi:hypothetical protein
VARGRPGSGLPSIAAADHDMSAMCPAPLLFGDAIVDAARGAAQSQPSASCCLPAHGACPVSPYNASRPAPVIRTRVTSISLPPLPLRTRSDAAVTSPARTNSTSTATEAPWTISSASVAPRGPAWSTRSRTRRDVTLDLHRYAGTTELEKPRAKDGLLGQIEPPSIARRAYSWPASLFRTNPRLIKKWHKHNKSFARTKLLSIVVELVQFSSIIELNL